MAAFIGEEIVGGATAHTLPMTKSEAPELFLYDIAVRSDQQRKGIGRSLVTALCEQAREAGILDVFVFADNDDLHALDFYRALGGMPSAVTSFAFSLASLEKEKDCVVPPSATVSPSCNILSIGCSAARSQHLVEHFRNALKRSEEILIERNLHLSSNSATES